MSARTAGETAALLSEALRSHGLPVGVDDTLRLAQVLSHAGGWSQERRVRAVKALLGRSEADRAAIDQVGPWIVAGPRVPSTDVSTPVRADVVAIPARAQEPIPPTPETPRPMRRGRWAVVGLTLAIATVVIVAVMRQGPSRHSNPDGGQREGGQPGIGQPVASQAEASQPEASQAEAGQSEAGQAGSGQPGAGQQAAGEQAAGKQAAVQPEAGQPAGGEQVAVQPETGGPTTKGKPASNPEGPRSPPSLRTVTAQGVSAGRRMLLDLAPSVPGLAFALAGLAVAALELGRRRSMSARRAVVRELALSIGPRVFTPDSFSPGNREPLDRAAMREMAFNLVPPAETEEAPWIDVQRTIEDTVRRGGHFELRYGVRPRDRNVILIEDVGPSMVRWPLHGKQLARNLAAQGRPLVHLFMRGEPSMLGATRDFSSGQPLDKVLARHPQHAVVVLSDAAALDEPEQRRRAQWVSRLAGATWLHPRPRELWSDGARWLHERARLNALANEELRRIGPAAKPLPLRARWHPPPAAGSEAKALSALWRFALGAKAYSALSSSAVLSTARALNTTTFWMLMADVQPDGAWARLERLWDLPGIRVNPSGEIVLPEEAATDLVDELAASDPRRARAVAAWLRRLMERAGLATRRSLAGAQALVQLARAYAAVGMLREEHALVRELKQEGLTELFSTQLSSTERTRWQVGAVKKPSVGRAIAGAALVLGGVGSFAVLRSTPAFECALPPTTTFTFTKEAHPRYASDAVATIVSDPPSRCPLEVWIDGSSISIPADEKKTWRLRLGVDCCRVDKSYRVSLGLSRAYPSPEISIDVGAAGEERDYLTLVAPAGSAVTPPANARVLYRLDRQEDALPGGGNGTALLMVTAERRGDHDSVATLGASEVGIQVNLMDSKTTRLEITFQQTFLSACLDVARTNSLDPSIERVIARIRDGASVRFRKKLDLHDGSLSLHGAVTQRIPFLKKWADEIAKISGTSAGASAAFATLSLKRFEDGEEVPLTQQDIAAIQSGTPATAERKLASMPSDGAISPAPRPLGTAENDGEGYRKEKKAKKKKQ